MMARNAWCYVSCYQYLCKRLYILFRFAVDYPHSPSLNTFSPNLPLLDVNVIERRFSHLFSTLSLCSPRQDVTALKSRCRIHFQKKKRQFSLLFRQRWNFFSSSHPTGRCLVHLLVKGLIFTQHCSSCSGSSLTYNESAWSGINIRRLHTDCFSQMRQQDVSPASVINISPATALWPLGGGAWPCCLSWMLRVWFI